MKISLTKIRKDLYKIPFEIMQLEKDIDDYLNIVKNKRKRLEYLKKNYK